MADDAQLVLAALAFLIIYVLMHIRKERFLMHWLNKVGVASGARRVARKPARRAGKRRRAGRR